LFVKSSNSEGVVDKNADFGVFGVISEDSKLLNEDALYEIGGRLTARPGKAKIRVAIDGNKVKDYDIEIIRTNFQNISKQKSMVIRVTDKELIRKTGGIVQGMSGSPIIQNSKVVGAVTHVFVNDPKKGFGVYLDWMINE
jgi:stage IV sporulation protein B